MDFSKLINVYYPEKVDKFFKEELPNANWNSVLVNVIIAIAVVTFASLIATLLGTMIWGSLGAIGGDVEGTAVSGAADLLAVIALAVIGFVFFFVGGFILYLIAQALGGKGTAEQFLYLLSIIQLALSPVSAIINLLSIIPCVGCLLLPVTLLVLVYMLYLYYKAIMAACGLDSGKSIIALVLWIIVSVVIAVIIIVSLLFLGLTSTMGPEALMGG